MKNYIYAFIILFILAVSYFIYKNVNSGDCEIGNSKNCTIYT